MPETGPNTLKMEDSSKLPADLPRIRQAPKWEVPTNPPKPPLKDRLKTFFTKPTRSSVIPAGALFTKQHNASGASDTLPTHTTPTAGFFDRKFPPNKTYFGRTRKFFILAVLAAIVLLILALGLGLGLGLKNSSKSKPIPTDGHVYTGDLTYYEPGLGACGWTVSSSDAICAISEKVYDTKTINGNPNNNAYCGRKILITRGSVQVEVKVVDRCTGCDYYDIDLAPSVFDKLADSDLGRVTGNWSWVI